MRYAGQYLDTVSDLYNMRAREYEPETGRFLQVDPLECDSGGACGSTYVYVEDQPTVKVDPSGERAMMSLNTTGLSQAGCSSTNGSCCSYSAASTGGPQGPQGYDKKILYGNGCGPGGWIEKIFAIPEHSLGLYNFSDACSHHDSCYGRRGSWGHTMSYCNSAFLSDMNDSCHHKFKHRYDHRRYLCEGVARIYKGAVDDLGQVSFYRGQMKLCPYSGTLRTWRCRVSILSRM